MNRLVLTKPDVAIHTSGWALALAAFGLAIIVLLAAYWQTVLSLVWVWDHDGTYQYAFLIFPLSAWAAFKLRHKLWTNPPRPSVWGLLAVAGLVCIWYVGYLLDVNLPQHFALVAMFPALVLTFWGWRVLWLMVFPLGYLVFAVPWGDALVGPLQDITAHIAVRALELVGTPVLVNGREIITPSSAWMVADACSGVKFFIACTALGCLYAYLMYRSWWKRVLFVALAALVPILANGLRVFFTILIGDAWGLRYATGTDHIIFGWQFFGTVLVILLLVGWFFRDHIVRQQDAPEIEGRFSPVRMTIWLPAMVLLVLGPVFAAQVSPAATSPGKPDLHAPGLAGWSGPRSATGNWRPRFQGASAEFQAAYQQAGGNDVVELFQAVYAGRPHHGHNMVTFGNEVYDPGRSRVLSSTGQHISLARGQNLTATELWLTGAGGSRLVWYWYCVGAHCTRSPVLVKLFQAWEVLRGRVPQSAVWALSSSIANGNLDQTRIGLRAFARELSSEFTEHSSSQALPDIGGGGS